MSQHPVTIEDYIAGMPQPETVRQLESRLAELPQVDLRTTMTVHGGMCARTIFIPAGTMLTGALTKCDNLCVVDGDITVTTDAGPVHLLGFNVLPAKAGAKRVGFAHGDTWWTTIHRTDETELDAIEREMTDEHAGLQTNTLALAKTHIRVLGSDQGDK